MAVPKSGRRRWIQRGVSGSDYAYAGLLLAALCVASGVALFVLRAKGEVAWDANFMAGRVHLDTAAPGVVCFVVAALVVYLTRPSTR